MTSRFERDREALLARLRVEVPDERVIAAIAAVPREAFVPLPLRKRAYENVALPIGEGQTISQPLIVALMCSAITPRPADRVLEVGTGSGYQAAVLSRLVPEGCVVTVERLAGLAVHAAARLQALGVRNVEVHIAPPDSLGWPGGAPYDGIIVAAGAPSVPQELVKQLKMGGRLVAPVGPLREQRLLCVQRTQEAHEVRDLGGCVFVPLLGAGGWPEGRSNGHFTRDQLG